jgi:DNA repair exonuclease SbcCD ATPase subunit
MDHYKLTDELRQKLIESAAWTRAGVETRLDEGAEVIEEKRGGKGHPFKASTKKAAKTILQQHEGSESDDAEEAEELAEEVHVCPLCTSQLDESIDEERILEHLDVVMGLVERLSHLQEGEEDVEAVIDQALSELLLQDEEIDTLDEDEEVVEEE